MGETYTLELGYRAMDFVRLSVVAAKLNASTDITLLRADAVLLEIDRQLSQTDFGTVMAITPSDEDQ